MVDGGVTEEDENGFDAGRDGLFDALTAVDLCIGVVVDVHVGGGVGILAVGVLYAYVEGVGG